MTDLEAKKAAIKELDKEMRKHIKRLEEVSINTEEYLTSRILIAQCRTQIGIIQSQKIAQNKEEVSGNPG